MNLRDALLTGSEHGTDRLPVDADRRLRRRLGLESTRVSASARRVWLRPALAAVALAAVLAVVFVQTRPNQPEAVAGFVDTSKARWDGTLTGGTIDVHASSPASATVTWRTATIIAAAGTRLANSIEGGLVLTQGAIQIQRSDVSPLVVTVPMGRVVIAAYRSSITADRQSVTILLDDGTGQYLDAEGKAHPLIPGVPLVSPPPKPPVPAGSAEDASAPLAVPTPRPQPDGRATRVPGFDSTGPTESSGPPGATVPRRLDVPCTFKSDCEPGATCRKNESGESVCMGHGAEGAACWFDNDCVSNRCVQRRCAR